MADLHLGGDKLLAIQPHIVVGARLRRQQVRQLRCQALALCVLRAVRERRLQRSHANHVS